MRREIFARQHRRRLAVHGFGAREVLLLLQQLPNLHERSGIVWVECRGAAEVLERRRAGAELPLHETELAMQERAVGRRLDGATVGQPGLLELAAGGRAACRLDDVLQAAELEHLDPPAEVGRNLLRDRFGSVSCQRRFEDGQRVRVALEREQRLPLADQRRDVARLSLQRDVERHHRALGVSPRQRDVGEAGLCRIQHRDALQPGFERALGVAQVVHLQEPPADADAVRARQGRQ